MSRLGAESFTGALQWHNGFSGANAGVSLSANGEVGVKFLRFWTERQPECVSETDEHVRSRGASILYPNPISPIRSGR
jgi:hypothetical protein